MVGLGSGRWGWHARAQTVEGCLTLDANRWTREGILKTWGCSAGAWRWMDEGGQESCVGYEVCTRDETGPWLRLYYSFPATASAEDYRVGLTTTEPWFGGLRWWFLCPLVV